MKKIIMDVESRTTEIFIFNDTTILEIENSFIISPIIGEMVEIEGIIYKVVNIYNYPESNMVEYKLDK